MKASLFVVRTTTPQHTSDKIVSKKQETQLSTMASPICVYGESLEDVEILSNYVIDYERLCLASIQEDVTPSIIDTKGVAGTCGAKVLSIKTKYYTAELRMALHVLGDGVELSDVCECCILVVSSLEETFDLSVSSIASQAMDTNVDIKLLVVLKNDENTSCVDNLRGPRVMWTLDHSFEYIEIDMSSPAKGYAEREKDGLPRLMEALHTNMWSTMERSDPAGKKPESSSNVPGTVFSMPLLPQSSPLHDATSSAEVTSSAAATGAEVTEVGEDLQLGYRGLLEDKDDDDKVWDNFTSTIEAAKHLREQAVGGGLTDDVRRRRAADLAMQMCAMMDMGDDSGDSDEED